MARQSNGRVTIRDVSAAAGVSVSTVSNWLAERHDRMTPETRRAIAEAAARLGYQPSAAARTLRGQPTHLLGIIVPSIVAPSIPAIVNGLEEAARASGHALFVSNIGRHWELAEQSARAMIARGVEGIAFAFAVDDANTPAVRAAREAGLSVALLLPRGADLDGTAGLLLDNEAAMRQAAEHLWSHGHRRIGLAINPHATSNAVHRREGLRAALRERGGDLPDELIYEDGTDVAELDEWSDTEVGRRAAIHLCVMQDRPTAICAVTDTVAIGVLRGARELKLRVPEDLSVIGFDDLPVGQWVTPTLTTLSIDRNRLGRDLAALIIAGGEPREKVVVPTLVVRESSTVAPQPA